METISVLCLTVPIEDHQHPALKPGPFRVHPDNTYKDTSPSFCFIDRRLNGVSVRVAKATVDRMPSRTTLLEEKPLDKRPLWL